MSQFLKIFILMMASFSPNAFSQQDTGTEPTEEVPVFEAHMIDHPFKGCPAGSKCTKETGQLRQGWIDTLKTKKNRNKNLTSYKSKNGMPIQLWSYPLKTISKGISTWRSPCPQHNGKEVQYSLTEVMSKDLKSLLNQESFILSKAILKTAEAKYVLYPMPVSEAPIYISQKKMIYSLDTDGEYYGIEVNSNGDIAVIDTKKPDRFPEYINCSEEMIQAFKQLKYPDGFFKGLTCKSVWDIDTKSLLSMAYGWSCS